MFQAVNYNSVAVVADGVLPMSENISTNPWQVHLDTETNEIVFGKPGVYRLTAAVVFAPTTAGTANIRGVSGASNVEGLVSTFTTSAADAACTFVLVREIVVRGTCGGNDARISLTADVSGTMNNLVVNVEKLR